MPVRGRRVILRTRYQRVRASAGHGGPVILTTGDSLMQSLDAVLSDRLGPVARIVSDVKIGAAISNTRIYDFLAVARAQVARYHPQVSLVFLGTNDVLDIERPGGGRIPCCGRPWSEWSVKPPDGW